MIQVWAVVSKSGVIKEKIFTDGLHIYPRKGQAEKVAKHLGYGATAKRMFILTNMSESEMKIMRDLFGKSKRIIRSIKKR